MRAASEGRLWVALQAVMLALESRVDAGAVHRLAILGFVRTTCCRSGSFARDWFDRAGKAARWVGENVLSVHHFEWDREGFHIVLPDGSVEEGSLAGDVDVQRVKFHYLAP